MYRRFGSFILTLLLIHSAARLAAQEGSILPPAPTPTDVKPGSITCDECPYPYPSKYLDIRVYSQDVRIAYMDVAPQGTANGRTVAAAARQQLRRLLLQGDHRRPHEGRLPRHRPRPDRLRQIVEADCAVQLQLAGAQHLPDPAEGEGRAGDGGRPLDGRHAGGAAGDAVSEGDRAGGDLQPDRPHRRPLRSADAVHRRLVSAEPQDRLPEHPRRPGPLRGSRPEGVECGVRDLHADPLLVDAQRRLAAGWRWCRR